jgi:hypothetical protein
MVPLIVSRHDHHVSLVGSRASLPLIPRQGLFDSVGPDHRFAGQLRPWHGPRVGRRSGSRANLVFQQVEADLRAE